MCNKYKYSYNIENWYHIIYKNENYFDEIVVNNLHANTKQCLLSAPLKSAPDLLNSLIC